MAQDDAQWRQQVDARLVGPAANPPPGVTSNFTNGPSRHKYNIVCQTICLTTVTTLVAIRVYTKSRVLKSLGWDDGKLIVSKRCQRSEVDLSKSYIGPSMGKDLSTSISKGYQCLY